MFFKPKKKEEYTLSHSNRVIQDYYKRVNPPSCNRRQAEKYYIEMQLLAFKLSHYLNMNEDENEHVNQGNYNTTYLRENLSKKDFKFITKKFMEQLTGRELTELIKEQNSRIPNHIDTSEFFDEIDIGDSFYQIEYIPKNAEEVITRVVKKTELNKAIEEINKRIEVDSINVELYEYK